MIQAVHAVGNAGQSSLLLPNMISTPSTGQAIETSFSDALTAAATRAVGALQGAESQSIGALQGDVNTREVVDAVMTAEQTLQAAIAIRDKIVTAYLEVSRMAI